MNNNFIKLLNNHFKNKKNIIIYGSFTISSSNSLKLDDFRDIDVIQIVNGRKICKRITDSIGNKEIHQYQLSNDVLKDDIEKKIYGRVHACHLWGPLLIINSDKTHLVENFIQKARKNRAEEILDYMDIFEIKKFTVDDLLLYIYFIEGILKPYTFSFGPKYLKNHDNKIINQWKDDYRLILSLFFNKRIKKNGAHYIYINKTTKNFIELFTNDSISTQLFWKNFLLYHNNDWDQLIKLANKGLDKNKEIDMFYKKLNYYISYHLNGPVTQW